MGSSHPKPPAQDPIPAHDTPILGMTERPRVPAPAMYGDAGNFWVEYPSGLVDVSRTSPLPKTSTANINPPAINLESQMDIHVDGDRVVRVDRKRTALVVIDMQNFFLHPDLRAHPLGLECVQPLMNVVPALRSAGSKILWVNWGLTEHELSTIPPALIRGFKKHNAAGGFGSDLPGDFGRLLMRGAYNSELYGPLQAEFKKGEKEGTDVWIHKNRMSGLWGYQTALDLYLKENGITTLLFAGVNADQVSGRFRQPAPPTLPSTAISLSHEASYRGCVLGTLVDAYFRGYDCIVLKDATATTSPEGAYESVIYNSGGSYGFVTDTGRVIAGSAVKA
ncbi:hypothetical protein CVT24_005182 [Panaeolus cyanescens]|uniref:Isochorismatase-like domain-containing protein n=1 Tax=Panaeolus cyanescens TaxID=181874 RepID=A0A409Y949_9AGAR|nr:hypothetical protein CVT24_005182 [Panaeolus cyanescens]